MARVIVPQVPLTPYARNISCIYIYIYIYICVCVSMSQIIVMTKHLVVFRDLWGYVVCKV